MLNLSIFSFIWHFMIILYLIGVINNLFPDSLNRYICGKLSWMHLKKHTLKNNFTVPNLKFNLNLSLRELRRIVITGFINLILTILPRENHLLKIPLMIHHDSFRII